MLVYGNIYAGAQVLVVDTCMGLVTGAIAERQAGNGRILAGYEGQQPAADILRRFNFDKKTLESIQYFSYKDVHNFAKSEEDVDEPPIVLARDGFTPEEREQMANERIAKFTDDQRKRYEAKKAKNLANKIRREPAAVVRAWVREKSDSLVIACNYDPMTMLFTLLPYLACSKPFVVYSEFLEPLTRVFSKLQQLNAVIDLQLSETWTRDNQVLPGRTHPEMTMSACSGYILTGIKIHELPIATAASSSSLSSSPLNAEQSAEELEPEEGNEDDETAPPPAKKLKTAANSS